MKQLFFRLARTIAALCLAGVVAILVLVTMVFMMWGGGMLALLSGLAVLVLALAFGAWWLEGDAWNDDGDEGVTR